MDPKYKKQKEDFVSNLTGGSVMEMNLVTLVAPVRLYHLDQVCYGSHYALVGRVAVVCSTVETASLYAVHRRSMFDRLPPQLRCDIVRYDHLLRLPASTESTAPGPGFLPLFSLPSKID